jgi:hypothetical protein
MPQPRVLVAALALCGYLGIAHSVRNLYPFSTFEMYAGQRADSASRVIARDAAGGLHELDAYEAFRCDGPIPLGHETCAAAWPYAYSIYLDRQAAAFIDTHPGDGTEPVDVIRRIWRLSDRPGPPPFEDCLLQHCRAARRP